MDDDILNTKGSPLTPYVDSSNGCSFKGFYAQSVPLDGGVPHDCAHVHNYIEEYSLMKPNRPSGTGRDEHSWDNLTIAILKDLGYCLKTDFTTTKDCLFIKRETISSFSVFFRDRTKLQQPFKATLLDKTAPILTKFIEKDKPINWGSFSWADEAKKYHEIKPLLSNRDNLELTIEWQGLEKRIPLKEGTYSLWTTSEFANICPIENTSNDPIMEISAVVKKDENGFEVFLEAKESNLGQIARILAQKQEFETRSSILPLDQATTDLYKYVFAYRQIIRVDEDNAFSLVVKRNEHLYFQETVPESKLNREHKIRSNAHLIGTATQQSKILLKLNDKCIVAEFDLMPNVQQVKEVEADNGKKFKVNFEVVDKYSQSKIPEYFLLVDIELIS